MLKCAVLLSVCYLGLVMAQELSDNVNPSAYPPDCGENEYFGCIYACPPEKTCETRLINPACPAVVMPCIPKCICKAGYYRDGPDGECISEEECGPACREGEVYKECKDPCIDESCDALGSSIPGCESPEPCEPGCVCRDGSYKLYNFFCVPKCYCPGFRDSPECRN
ncbi:unnamed protein product [Spodoptera littoralis]|uniref:TIL domain-containing protein n=1 Tax=Spodoptera littoralis TaxID=7109 RepID=A0A9P0IC89_SPOLI|nr:unnamed protein product [Spodoptera littoralis]CAH1644142.1 unnamed protein product [Spodoptera littoralis]